MLDTNPQRGTIYLDDLKIGMSVQVSTTITQADIEVFAKVSGDHNPIHLDAEYGANSIFKSRIVHGSHTASLFSAAIGEYLPGHGSIYMGQTLKFIAPVRADDTVTTTVTITNVNYDNGHITVDCKATVGNRTVLTGEATVLAPSKDK